MRAEALPSDASSKSTSKRCLQSLSAKPETASSPRQQSSERPPSPANPADRLGITEKGQNQKSDISILYISFHETLLQLRLLRL